MGGRQVAKASAFGADIRRFESYPPSLYSFISVYAVLHSHDRCEIAVPFFLGKLNESRKFI